MFIELSSDLNDITVPEKPQELSKILDIPFFFNALKV